VQPAAPFYNINCGNIKSQGFFILSFPIFSVRFLQDRINTKQMGDRRRWLPLLWKILIWYGVQRYELQKWGNSNFL